MELSESDCRKLRELAKHENVGLCDKYVYLIDKEWFSSFTDFLHNFCFVVPGILNNDELFQKISNKEDVLYKKDFDIANEKYWDVIKTIFKPTQTIKRQITLLPCSDKPYVIVYHYKFVLNYENETYNKNVDIRWTFNIILRAFCERRNLDFNQYSFFSDKGTIINGNFSISDIIRDYKGDFYIRTVDFAKKNSNNNASISKSSSQKSLLVLSPDKEKRSRKRNVSNAASFSPFPVGLKNNSNLCYLNSALQILIRIPMLVELFLSPKFEKNINKVSHSRDGGGISYAFIDLINSFSNGSRSQSRDPSKIFREIRKLYPQFRDDEQHDSQEIMMALLDGLHEDLKRTSSFKDDIQASSSKVKYDSKSSSVIMDIFQGNLINTITCLKCKKSSHTYDPYVFLSLPIPQSREHTIDIMDCIRTFSQEDKLDNSNMYYCEHCKTMVQIVKKLDIHSTPQVLLIQLMRFSTSKISKEVIYPNVLHIDFHTDKGQLPMDYQLIGTVLHSGGMGFGHYVSVVLDQPTNNWYMYDDTLVRNVNQRNAHNGSAYIIAYQRKNN